MNALSLLKSRRVLGSLLVLGLFAGCDRSQTNASSNEPTAAATDPLTDADMYAADPPPLAQSEVMVASPGPDYVWVGGYWAWRPGPTSHTWVKGHWERPPQPRAAWREPRWEKRGKGYIFIRGSWH
jgi:hypothetical protein